VTKNTDPLEDEKPIAERENMAFKGTALTRGSGAGIVVATGMETELGHISEMAEAAQEEQTPLEKRLNQLGRRLIWVTLAIAVLVGAAGILGGKPLELMIKTAIALAVAAVPEGLPIVATVALARGMWRMAKRNAVINKLSAVETLGATSVICTDKTGTLTENRMTATAYALDSGRVNLSGEALELEGEFTQDEETLNPHDHSILRPVLEVGVLCNNAQLGDEGESDGIIGDPMEVALLVAGAKAGIRRSELLEKMPEVREVAFETETKMMATIHETDGEYRYAVKGAPEQVLEVCDRVLTQDGEQQLSQADRQHWQDQFTQMAGEGLRILAFAQKTEGNSEAEAYKNLTFLGVVGLLDPPREQVKDAIKECYEAGIRVVMVTGDQAITAQKVGEAVGLFIDRPDQEVEAIEGKHLKDPEDASKEERRKLTRSRIFARVNPEQKLNLIALHQKARAIVAMTGDGVNDAPALQKADIGIAMGERGTQVAKEAADMILQDDAFSTIVAAVEQGRAIFENIRKFTIYLLSGNIGQIIAVASTSIVGAPLPLLPLQILFLNVINDVFPALALGVGEGDPHAMQRPPRNSEEAILTRRHWGTIFGYGFLIAVPVLGGFALALQWFPTDTETNQSPTQAVTISFLGLAFARLWHVFNMRNNDSGVFRNEVTQNRYVWMALALCSVLLLLAVYVPFLANVLSISPPGFRGWLLILAISVIPVILGQLVKVAISKKQ
jgi:Ca2+-transporting ATPase